MERQEYIIDARHEGMRVKDYIRRVLGISSRALIGLKKAEEGITINGSHARVVDILKSGDVLGISLLRGVARYEEVNLPLDIVYEDSSFIVVDKPYGMTVYPCGRNRVSLLNGMAFYFGKKGEPCVFRPFYRLDKDTSGLVVIGKSNVFMAGTQVEKEYFAVCRGVVPEEGIIDAPIGRVSETGVARAAGFGQEALTRFKRVGTDGEHSLVKLKLDTGRTHQIRVHMASIGFPLCGDSLYGGDLSRIKRQALHCKNCVLKNPAIEMDMKLETPFPDDMRKAFPGLNL